MTKPKPTIIDLAAQLRSVRYLLLAATVLTVMTFLAMYTFFAQEGKLDTCKRERTRMERMTQTHSAEGGGSATFPP